MSKLQGAPSGFGARDQTSKLERKAGHLTYLFVSFAQESLREMVRLKIKHPGLLS
jgi:hypothetical protein